MADGYRSLKDISLEMPTGSFTVIAGSSGSGKSSLINVGAGLKKCSSGKVLVENKDLALFTKKSYEEFLREIVIIQRNTRLLDCLNVYQNIALPLMLKGINNRKIRKEVLDSLEYFGLRHKELSSIKGLTASQRLRVNLARGLVKKPKAILADDPTFNLGVQDSGDLIDCLYKFKQMGSTILLVISNTRIAKFKDARVRTLWRGELTH